MCSHMWCRVMYSSWVITFYWCASAGPFSDEKKWYNLKMLGTWVDPLNISKVCAIFSVSVVPHACPAHSLQFIRFRHTVSVGEIVPPHHSSTSGSCIDFLDLRLTEWLLTGWGLLGYHEKVCQTRRLVETRPRGPCLLNFSDKLPQKPTSTGKVWCVQPLSCFKQSKTIQTHCVTVVTLQYYKEVYLVCLWHWLYWKVL